VVMIAVWSFASALLSEEAWSRVQQGFAGFGAIELSPFLGGPA
jgi:hypothetical protein